MASKKNNLGRFDIDMTPLHDFMKRMDTFFNESFKQINSNFHLRPFWVDVYEKDSEIIVEAELPGVKRDQIEIEIVGNQLRIAVEDSRIIEEKNDKLKVYHNRRSFQKMERFVTLPFPVSEKDTTASFQNGLLRIAIPNKKEDRKFIPIRDPKK